VQWIKSVIAIPFPGLIKDTGEGSAEAVEAVEASVREGTAAIDDQIVKARDSNASKWRMVDRQEYATNARIAVWTQLALAYAVHKSLIFIRVPLTAAVLPKVVRTLRGWGWNIGKRKPKST
jgi:hypothetical protein